MTTPAFDALELFCNGMSAEQVGTVTGHSHPRYAILRAARIVGRLGFWKFHCMSVDDAFQRRHDLLRLMRQCSLMSRKEAA